MDFKKYPMAEPYKIKMVEPLKVTTREYREKAMKEAGYVTETPVIITNQDQFQADERGQLPRMIELGDKLMMATRIG